MLKSSDLKVYGTIDESTRKSNLVYKKVTSYSPLFYVLFLGPIRRRENTERLWITK